MRSMNLVQHSSDKTSLPAPGNLSTRSILDSSHTNVRYDKAMGQRPTSILSSEKLQGDSISLYAIEPPPPTAAASYCVPAFTLSNCRPSRIVVITVPPRGNFGNLTDANEEEFHFVNYFYEKVQVLGEIERVFCYRECLPNGTIKSRMIVAFNEIQSAIQCVLSHDSQPFMGTKRITRCQFLSVETYDRLKSLKPE